MTNPQTTPSKLAKLIAGYAAKRTEEYAAYAAANPPKAEAELAEISEADKPYGAALRAINAKHKLADKRTNLDRLTAAMPQFEQAYETALGNLTGGLSPELATRIIGHTAPQTALAAVQQVFSDDRDHSAGIAFRNLRKDLQSAAGADANILDLKLVNFASDLGKVVRAIADVKEPPSQGKY